MAVLAALFDATPDAVLVHRDWIVVYANAALLALLRAQHIEAVIGRPISAYMATERASARTDRVGRLYAGEAIEVFEETLDRHDGTLVEVEMSASPFDLDQQPAALVIVRDIGMRKELERRARASEVRHRELFESNPHVMVVFDTQTLRFLAVNDTAVARYGYSHEEFAAMGLLDIFVAEDAPRLLAQQASMPHTVRQITGYRHRLKGGEIIDVELTSHTLTHQGRPARMVVVFDVTARLRAERALRGSEARYRAIFEQAAMGIARTDLDGRFIETNQGLAAILGYSRDELAAMRFQEITHPDDLEADLANVRRLVAGSIAQYGMEKRYRHKDGFYLWAALTVALIRNAEGSPDGYVALIENIDRRKRTEAALADLHQRLSLAVLAGNVGLWDWDMRLGAVKFSSEWKQQIGYADDEIGESFTEWESRVHADDLPGVMVRVRAHLEGASGGMLVEEFRLRHKDGSYRTILAQSHVLRDGTGRPARMLGCHIDITERRRIEDEVRAREEQYRRLVELSPDAVFIVTEERIVFANGAAARMLGASDTGMIIGARLADYLQETADRDAAIRLDGAQDCQITIPGAPTREVEVRQAEVTWQGRPARKLIARDVTERLYTTRLLQDYAHRLKGLSRELLEAEERERRNLHRELHDRIGQNLSALGMALKVIQGQLPMDAQAGLGGRLGGAQALLAQTTQRVRDIMQELHPPGLQEYGLAAALRVHVETAPEGGGLAIDLRAQDMDPRPPYVCEVALFRIVQEALTNVLKHAAATRVRIEFTSGSGHLRILIEDDGRGFDLAAVRDGPSWGLTIMRERAESVGAALAIESSPGRGTRVALTCKGPWR